MSKPAARTPAASNASGEEAKRKQEEDQRLRKEAEAKRKQEEGQRLRSEAEAKHKQDEEERLRQEAALQAYLQRCLVPVIR